MVEYKYILIYEYVQQCSTNDFLPTYTDGQGPNYFINTLRESFVRFGCP